MPRKVPITKGGDIKKNSEPNTDKEKNGDSGSSDRARQRRKMEACMFRAVENNELCLYYQPVVAAKTGNVIGVEALMRWNSPQLGFLPPDDFIPLAEDNGLIVKFGEWAIREVCRQHNEWQQQGMP